MVDLAMMTYAMPPFLGRDPYNQNLNILSFWTLTDGRGDDFGGAHLRRRPANLPRVGAGPGLHGRAAATRHLLLDPARRRHHHRARARPVPDRPLVPCAESASRARFAAAE